LTERLTPRLRRLPRTSWNLTPCRHCRRKPLQLRTSEYEVPSITQ